MNLNTFKMQEEVKNILKTSTYEKKDCREFIEKSLEATRYKFVNPRVVCDEKTILFIELNEDETDYTINIKTDNCVTLSSIYTLNKEIDLVLKIIGDKFLKMYEFPNHYQIIVKGDFDLEDCGASVGTFESIEKALEYYDNQYSERKNYRNAGRKTLDSSVKKITKSIQLTPDEIQYIEENGIGKSFAEKVSNLIFKDADRNKQKLEEIKKILEGS